MYQSTTTQVTPKALSGASGNCSHCMTQMPLASLRISRLRKTAQNSVALICCNVSACAKRERKFFAQADDLTTWVNPGQYHVLICDQCRAFGHLRSGDSWLIVKRFVDGMLAKERADEAARRAEWVIA